MLYEYICKNYSANTSHTPKETIYVEINGSTGAFFSGTTQTVTLIMTNNDYNKTYGIDSSLSVTATGIGFQITTYSYRNGFALNKNGLLGFWSTEATGGPSA